MDERPALALDTAEGLLTIGQMRERFGVTARTLRFYETRKLLNPERQGQHRLYDRRDRARLQLILRGKRFGFTLDEIQHLLDLYDPDSANIIQLEAAITAGEARLAALRADHDDIASAIDELGDNIEQARQRIARAKADGNP